MYDVSYRSKLSSHLDRLYIVSGSFGSRTLSEQSCDGSCYFAHCHVVVQFCVTSPERFTLSTRVYQLPETLAEDFGKLNETLSECRKGLVQGHIQWSDDSELTIQLDLPLAYLEKSRYSDFERSMNDFMNSYWKVRNNLAQYAGKSALLDDCAPGAAASSAAATPRSVPKMMKSLSWRTRRDSRSGRRLRTLRSIFPKR